MENSPFQASADIGNASIDYVRDGRRVEIRIAGEMPELTAHAADLPASVQACCEQEIMRLRQSFRRLADELAGQLNPQGSTPPIPQGPTRWSEQRSWRRSAAGEFTVRPSAYRVETRVRLPRGPLSDAGIVRQVIENETANRELAVRAVYEQVARDVARVAAKPSSSGDAAAPSLDDLT